MRAANLLRSADPIYEANTSSFVAPEMNRSEIIRS